MSFIANELKHRAHIKLPVQTPNPITGGFDQTYATVLSFWCAIENESAYIKAVRGEQLQDGITHILKARWMALKNLGKESSDAFDAGFDNIADINMVKSNFFLFIESSVEYRGRIFRVVGMAKDERFKEWVRIQVREIEEQGTGAKV